ncbi:MAG TPA: hypothetical protein VFY52_00880 [Thermoleophilaceae bacterium]|nr:hypothetical protein [Thermoleophilaceae bacterium]
MRKLWTARVLFLLSAVALGAVVLEERQQQERESATLLRISGPAEAGHVIDLRVDGYARPRAFSTTVYRNWSAAPRPRPGSRRH